MTVEETNRVDIVGLEEATGTVRLIMTEHRDWTDCSRQLTDLAAKLDSYIQYVASGQLYDEEPDWRELPVAFDLYCLFEPPEALHPVFARLAQELAEGEITFSLFRRPDLEGPAEEIDFFGEV